MALIKEKKRLGDMLIAENTITEDQLKEALELAPKQGKKIGEVLVEHGYTTEDDIARALSRQLNLEILSLTGITIPEEIINLVKGSILRKYIMIPIAYDKNNVNVIRVAMADPMDMIAIDDFSIITNLQVEPMIATQKDILLAIDKYYGDTEAMVAAQQYAIEREEALQKMRM